MKRVLQLLVFIVVFLSLVACNTQVSEKTNPNVNGESESTGKESANENGESQPLAKESPKPYVKGVGEVDVLNTHGGVEGIERMQRFYEEVKKGVPADLRLAFYTVEGDPIVKDVKFDGKSLEVKNDTTRDAYGSGEINTITCGQLIEEVNPTNTSYIATDCKDSPFGMELILGIYANMSQQDLFEIVLKYGENLENEINTKTNISKQDGGTKEPFFMSENAKQQLYEKLVFANYLDEKKSFESCDQPNSIKYYLKVYINGGNREIHWKDCDKSPQGAKFTKIANGIIEESKKNQSLTPEVIVQGYVLARENNTLLIGEELNRMDYEWLKNEIKQMDMNSFIFDFTELEGVPIEKFQLGDKIRATIDGDVIGAKPGRAKVKEIKKIN